MLAIKNLLFTVLLPTNKLASVAQWWPSRTYCLRTCCPPTSLHPLPSVGHLELIVYGPAAHQQACIRSPVLAILELIGYGPAAPQQACIRSPVLAIKNLLFTDLLHTNKLASVAQCWPSITYCLRTCCPQQACIRSPVLAIKNLLFTVLLPANKLASVAQCWPSRTYWLRTCCPPTSLHP